MFVIKYKICCNIILIYRTAFLSTDGNPVAISAVIGSNNKTTVTTGTIFRIYKWNYFIFEYT